MENVFLQMRIYYGFNWFKDCAKQICPYQKSGIMVSCVNWEIVQFQSGIK